MSLALFMRKGYHRTSVNDIKKRVGVTKAAFYSHFESKGQLLLKIINEYETRYVDQLIQIVSQHSNNAASTFPL